MRGVSAAVLVGGLVTGCGVAFQPDEASSTAGGAGGPSGVGGFGGDATGPTATTNTGGSGASGGAGGTGGSGGGGGMELGPFGEPVALEALNSMMGEDDPCLTDDMLEIVFDRAGDVWTATRGAVSDPWGAPTLVTEVSSTSGETTPEISGDGLTLLISSNRDGPNNIYRSTRANRAAAWSTPVMVTELSSSDGEFAPYASKDRLNLMMGSTRPGPGGFDLWASKRTSLGEPWEPPVLVALSTAAVETDPWFDSTGRHLYFSSDRDGGVGGWDVWYAQRDRPEDPWGTPTNVTELNTTDNDGDVWLSPDMTVVVMSRGGDLYQATR